MSANYRFSWQRPSGWNRMGLVGAVGIIFVTPMLWSLGVFGTAEDALQRAMIFLFAGLWFFAATGWVLGWALRGFMVRLKEAEDEPAEERGGHGGHAPAPPPRPKH